MSYASSSPGCGAREAAQPVGEAMSGDLRHDIAGPKPRTVDGARYVDDDAVGPIERDDRAVRRCVEPHRDGDDTEQHKYDRDNRRCPAGKTRTPDAPLGRLHRRRRAHVMPP